MQGSKVIITQLREELSEKDSSIMMQKHKTRELQQLINRQKELKYASASAQTEVGVNSFIDIHH